MRSRCAIWVSFVVLLGAPGLAAQIDDFNPVTDEMLRSPAPRRLGELEGDGQRVGLQSAR